MQNGTSASQEQELTENKHPDKTGRNGKMNTSSMLGETKAHACERGALAGSGFRLAGQHSLFTEKLWFSERRSFSRQGSLAKRNGGGLSDDDCTCGFVGISSHSVLRVNLNRASGL